MDRTLKRTQKLYIFAHVCLAIYVYNKASQVKKKRLIKWLKRYAFVALLLVM